MTGDRRKWMVIAVVTVVLAVILSPFASPHPDGLERVAEDQDFIEKAKSGFSFSPFPDYTVELPFSGIWQTALAGLIGIAVIAAVLWLVGRVLAARRNRHV